MATHRLGVGGMIQYTFHMKLSLNSSSYSHLETFAMGVAWSSSTALFSGTCRALPHLARIFMKE